MNILIKLMSIVSLVIAPTLANLHKDDVTDDNVRNRRAIEKVVEAKAAVPVNAVPFVK
jgi:K(+)-stimulated pyrophosphate-energized sodium pump